jgi:glycosyltransferase involved in cell wall biosynthesis
MTESVPIKVSVIVACWNEQGHIRGLVESIQNQAMEGVSWEAIIADGMSDDGTRKILQECSLADPRIRVIDNLGRIVSTGLNQAIHAARGEIIVRMDAHTLYSRDYCRRCLEVLESTGADNVGGPARTQARGAQARAIAAAYHSRFSTGGARFHDISYEGWVDTVPYGCWLKETLLRIGLFDEALVRNQDDELNLRLVREGGKIWQSPAIVSWYSPRAKLSALFRQYFQYGFWKVAVIRKHRLPASWRHLVPVVFVLANALLILGALAAAAAGAEMARNAAGAAWLIMVSAYAGLGLLASIAAARQGGWVTLPYLPFIFAAYHISYGLGFFFGIVAALQTPRPRAHRESVFTQITR